MVLAVAGLWVLWTWPVPAQDSDRPVLRVPWAGDAGFGFVEADGTPRSFFIDLARMIGDEAGIEIDLVKYPSPPAATQSIRDGETDMLAGAGRAAFDDKAVAFAGPVAETQFILFLRKEAPPDLGFATFGNRRIGVLRNSVASRLPLPDGARIVAYDDQVTAFAKLLNEEVDGVVVLSPLGQRTLNTTGLDTLIRPSFPPVRELRHFVALRRAHIDLMPRIEAAIAHLEESGALEELRNEWYMVPPVPVPDVLTVGVTHFPPFYVVRDDGTISGFAVEAIRELAQRAGIDLQFKTISLESWSRGPRLGAFDLLPVRSVTEAEKELLQFTDPIQTIDYVTFVRAAEADAPLMRTDGRIGVLFSSPLLVEIGQALGVDLVPIENTEAGAKALGSGEIDALIYPRSTFERFLAEQGESGRFARLPEPVFRNDLAIALRPGLKEVRDRLNVVIRGYMGSAQYRKLASHWFDAPPFWTPERLRLARIAAAGAAAGAFLLILLFVLLGRRRAVRHARAMESVSNRLGAILNTARSGILGFNPAGEIAIANMGARNIIAAPDTRAPFRWPAEISFLDPDAKTPLDAERHPIDRALAGATLDGEVALIRRSDEDEAGRYVRLSSSPVVAAQAEDISTVVVLDDITDLYEAHSRAEREARIAATAQKHESLGKLTGGMAHDFNNLLAVILANLDFLQEDDSDPKRAELVRMAIAATLRGADLTRNMLAFARRAPLEAEVLDFNETVRSVKQLAARTVPASVGIETSLMAGLWKIRADRASTESALLNLIVNANDAMEGQGRLTIETTNLRIEEDYIQSRGEDIPPGRYAMLAVTDTGPGIPPDILDRIFEPFFSTKGPQGGTGLGLSMVQGFLKQTGGTVRVYSEEGVGTTFKLFFPALHESDAADPTERDTPAVAAGAGQRILLVEDEADVLAAFARALERAGYAVVAANTGDRALKIFESDPGFDLVVTDIVMPGQLQGPALVNALRALSPDLPAVFMSGYAEEATVHGNGLRPSDIRLMKPIQRKPFLAAVHRALSQAPPRPR